MQRRPVLKTLAMLALPGLGARSVAQDAWPTRSVKIIAPVAPGGGVDLVARTMAERLGKALGQTFIVDNQSGGGGTIASQAVSRAAPDGYTLMLAYVGTHGTNPAVRKLPYDAVGGFTPIGMVGARPTCWWSRPARRWQASRNSSPTSRPTPASSATARPARAR